MADPTRGDVVEWYSPDPRAVIPLDGFKISRSLRRTLNAGTFKVTSDRVFGTVLGRCANRETTWISDEISVVYTELHDLGFAHSVETWLEGALVGGLYGVALGGAFFGESMFHDRTDASKVALAGLVERLKAGGYTLLDIQFMTDHLKQFGAIEIARPEYEDRLEAALRLHAAWVHDV